VSELNYQQVELTGDTSSKEPLRFWGNQAPDFLYDEATKTTVLSSDSDSLNILALSGGGANGAFGAGVVNGMYQTGNLPDFSIVTGVSAGALIAPFVFVGGDEIEVMKQVMLGISDKAILANRNYLNAIFKDGISTGKGLNSFIEATFDEQMIAKIAAKHNSGKRLFIGTTHFDSGKQVVWNLGQIAASNHPQKDQLIHQVLAASSSIPGVFPPQFVDVSINGEALEEMHVDGGLSAQMFADPAGFDYGKIAQALGINSSPNIYIVRNGRLDLPYQTLKDKGVQLLGRSVQSLTLNQNRGDLYRILYFSEKHNFDAKFTYVSEDFTKVKSTKKMFDQDYMQALYNYGYQKVVKQQWYTELP
jgi:predicted patatin/cPLA2 family phospholipase